MDNILRDEVNQHTSEEVEKVLAELEAQGVDLTAIKEALANAGGSSAVKSVQRGTIDSSTSSATTTVTIEPVDMNKSLLFVSDYSTSYSSGVYPKTCNFRYELSSNNTIKITRYEATSSLKATFAWQVIEFN